MNKFTVVLLSLVLFIALTVPTFAAPPQSSGACEDDYSVQADDWLSKLADKFYGDILTYPAIFAATNLMAQVDTSYTPITNPDLIEPGWKLCIPTAEDAEILVANTINLTPSESPSLDEVLVIAPIKQTLIFDAPLDVTPDPDAHTFYFTASSPNGPGVFSVPARGGETIALAVGSPFVTPLGIAISTTGRQLFIADPQAGQLFVVPVEGGAPALLAGSVGTAPRGLEVINENGTDQVYFSGVDPSDGQPAVLKLPSSGSETPTIIARGAPLVEPGGVAITKSGVVYVADRAASGNGLGSVFKIEGGNIETLVSNVRMGNPVGATLTLDEAILLVSAMHPTEEHAQVLAIELASGNQQIVTKIIGDNAGSGGVHRAHNQNVFVWVDVTPPRGRSGIHRITVPNPPDSLT